MSGNIREYTNQDNQLQPGEAGPTTFARAATRMGVMGHQTGAYIRESGALIAQGIQSIGRGLKDDAKVIEDIQAQNEISTFTNALMQTHDKLDKNWADTRGKADPALSVGPSWMQQTAVPTLDKLAEGLATKAGRDHAQQMVNSAKLHYGMSARADDMAAAGDNVVRNMQVVVDGATRRSGNDVTTVDYNGSIIAQSFDAAIKSGNLDAREQRKLADAKEKAVKENALAGIKGAIDRNPTVAQNDIKGWADKYNLDFKTQDQLREYARHIEREKKADARGAAYDAEIATRKASEAAFQKTLNDIGPEAVNNAETWTKLAGNALIRKDMTSEDRVRLLNLSLNRQKAIEDAQTGKILRPNPMAEYGLFSRLGDDTNPLTKEQIDDAVRSPDLSKRITADQGIKLYKELATHDNAEMRPENREWTEAKKEAIAGIRTETGIDATNMKPGAGYQFGAAQSYIRQQFDLARKKGLSTGDLTDPDSKNYYLRDPGLRRILKDPKPFLLKNVPMGESGGSPRITPPVGGKPASSSGGKGKLDEILDGK